VQLPPPVPGLPFHQPIILPAQLIPALLQNIMAIPAQVQTGKFREETPDIFQGEHATSETFMQQFDIHWGLNDNHKVMSNPYLCAMYFLSLIKGPLVNDWVNNQVTDLRNKVVCTVNPIAQREDVLWNDVRDAFIAAYVDTAKA